MKRSPMPQRRTPLVARSGLQPGQTQLRRSEMNRGGDLRPVSKKRQRQERTYSSLRREFLTTNPTCALCGVKPATEVHHKAGRVGALLLDVTRWAALDSDCHRWVTEHPAAAYACGISERRVA